MYILTWEGFRMFWEHGCFNGPRRCRRISWCHTLLLLLEGPLCIHFTDAASFLLTSGSQLLACCCLGCALTCELLYNAHRPPRSSVHVALFLSFTHYIIKCIQMLHGTGLDGTVLS